MQLVKSDKNRPWIVYSNENQQKSYVGIINGATLANLWNSKARLFWLNIRSSLGETFQ